MASHCKEVREALLHVVCMGLFTTDCVMSQVFTVSVKVSQSYYIRDWYRHRITYYT